MRLLLAFCFILITHPTWAWQEDHGEDESRTERDLDKSRLDLTGWVDVTYRATDLEDTSAFFNLNHAYLGLGYRISEAWRGFVEGEFEREPPYGADKSSELFKLDRAFLEYRHSAAARLRIGKVNTPAGIWKPLHWALTVDTITAPIMEDNGYIPIKSEGIEFSGIKALAQGELNYTMIAAYVDDEESKSHNLEDATAYGGDLNLTLQDRYILGFSVYTYSDPRAENEAAVGLLPYLNIELVPNRLIFTGEWLFLRRDDGINVSSFYTQFKYRFNPKTYVNLRHDQGDDERRSFGTRHKVNTLTLAWWPKSNWRFKGEYEVHSFVAELQQDFDQWSLWTGYIFK